MKKNQGKKLNHTEAVSRIAEIHGGKISVLSQYIRADKRLVVQCECGYKWAPLAHALFSGQGCRNCIGLRRLNHDEAIARIKEIHGSKITLIGKYLGTTKTVLVRCECGYQWNPRGSDILGGSGCRKCGAKRQAEKVKIDHATFIERIAGIHGDRITVLSRYIGSTDRLVVRCQCGNEWRPLAYTILRGSGCPKCIQPGFQRDKPAIAYYLRITTISGSLYKIGVTNRTVAKRFGGAMTKITILKVWNFAKGADAYEFEQQVLRENAFEQYRGPDVLIRGNDELFVSDILGLDVNEPFFPFIHLEPADPEIDRAYAIK